MKALIVLVLLVASTGTSVSVTPSIPPAKASLWDRLGGLSKLKLALSKTVDRHFDDPLTAPYFGPHKFDNNGTRAYVKKQVLHFFSAGVGGPYGYSGKDMIAAHSKMEITETAFHALSYHLLAELEDSGAKVAELNECLGILQSLKADVQARGKLAAQPPSIYDGVAQFHKAFTVTVPAYFQQLPLPNNVNEIASLSLDEWFSLLPLFVLLGSPTILLQLFKKVGQSHNLDKNNSGFFQFSAGPFYSGSIIGAVPFLLGLVPAVLTLFGTLRGGNFTWLTPIAGYVLVPIVDLILGEDSYNPTKDEEAKLKKNIFFRVVTWLYVVALTSTLLVALYAIQTNPSLSTFELIGITVSVGVSGGFGIGCVHELIHRPNPIELALGIYSTVLANYSHFWIEHLWGHHKRVATDLDPASSQVGDNIYTFWPQCIYQSFVDALDIESRYLKQKGLSVLSNRILQGYTASAILATFAYNYAGISGLYFWIGQGIVVALHIENANFIEHYGLRRRKIEGKFDKDGEPIYERPGWFHAWDTADRLTNWMLFKIQRHPDHHTNAGRPYQILRTFAQSPTMPTGYAGMFVLSWFPPLFAAIMDPLVERAYRQREEMERLGVAASSFPSGSNNISSFFKKEGEGFFKAGSSPYQTGDFYESDVSKPKDVWANVDSYDKIYEDHESKSTVHKRSSSNIVASIKLSVPVSSGAGKKKSL